MKWSRWSGAGNTFLIADGWSKSNPSNVVRAATAVRLCSSFGNAKTDGLLFIESQKDYDFAWDFYNSDGSRAEMCGNAARCAAMYFYKKLDPRKKQIQFLTLAGKIGAEIITDSTVRVEMPELPLSCGAVEGSFHVNTGVPHTVLEARPDLAMAQKLRPLPTPAGANVTFVFEITKFGCKAVTFERGVEDFTLACGTGAVAAAAYLNSKMGGSKFEIQMPGGQLLIDNVVLGKKPLLEGPALWNYDFEEIDL